MAMARAVGLALEDHWQVRQSGTIPRRDLRLSREKLVDTRQLSDADRSTDVRHSVVVANDVVPVLTVICQPLALEMYSPIVERLVVGCQHPALAGGDGLVAEETERRDVAKGAHMATADQGTDPLGAVLDNEDIVLPGNLADCCHVAGRAIEVDGHDCSGAGCDPGPRIRHRHLPGPRLAIAENRLRAGVGHSIGRGDIGERRDNHLIARADPERNEGQMQGHRPIADTGRKRCPDIVGELPLEPRNEGAFRRYPSGGHALQNVVKLLLSDVRSVDGDALLHELKPSRDETKKRHASAR